MMSTTSSSAKESQTTKILKAFKMSKRLTNRQLNNICFRYSARILELRNDGYLIVPVREKAGLWSYTYKGHVDDKDEYADID